MNARNIAIAIALSSAAISSAFAADTGQLLNGELGYVPAPFHGTLTRDEVERDLASFQRNPVTADGSRFVGGEVGYEYPSHSYAIRNGKLVHTDNIAHNTPRKSGRMTPNQIDAFQDSYPGG
jgi:opacity protein-like surface antigen